MPIEEVISTMNQHYQIEESQIPHFRKRLRKTKNILKRNRAKGRKNIPDHAMIFDKKNLIEESSLEKDTQEFEK